MLENGQYVRLKMDRPTRMGTIEGSEERRGRMFYIFRQDQRFKEAVSGFVFEVLLPEEELESCKQPSDEYWKAINYLSECGS